MLLIKKSVLKLKEKNPQHCRFSYLKIVRKYLSFMTDLLKYQL